MKNKSLRFKLYALSGFLIFLSILIGVVGYVSETKIINEYSYVAERNLPNIKSIGLMISRYRLVRSLATELAIEGITKEEGEATVEAYKKGWTAFDEAYKAYMSVEFAPGEDEVHEKFKAAFEDVKKSLDNVVALYEKGIKEGSVDQKAMAAILIKEVKEKGNKVRDTGNELLKFHTDRADLRVEAATKIAHTSTILIVATIVVGSLLGTVFAFTFSKALVNTLSSISTSLNEAGMQVSSGANQIASTSQELSQATTEQSASLEETAASIEEMNSMVQKSSENAKMTLNYAESSKVSAVTGKEVVVEMMDSIEEINKSNQNIMVAIDESNKKMEEIAQVIGEIGNKTKVINDIVFQTKLLSFNASVEAARAGEMGKGFAVVAEEVGNLAEMSGNAAKEISEMLNASITKVDDIVKTTKSKVERLVDEGKRKVEAGTVVAKKCGEVLDTIVSNVDDVNKLASEISSASEEQAKGIQEISKAASMLENVTQQNSTASEEAARAAEDLSKQAMSLNQIVAELVGTINGGVSHEMARAVTQQRHSQTASKKERKPISRIAVTKSEFRQKASGEMSAPSSDDDRFVDA